MYIIILLCLFVVGCNNNNIKSSVSKDSKNQCKDKEVIVDDNSDKSYEDDPFDNVSNEKIDEIREKLVDYLKNSYDLTGVVDIIIKDVVCLEKEIVMFYLDRTVLSIDNQQYFNISESNNSKTIIPLVYKDDIFFELDEIKTSDIFSIEEKIAVYYYIYNDFSNVIFELLGPVECTVVVAFEDYVIDLESYDKALEASDNIKIMLIIEKDSSNEPIKVIDVSDGKIYVKVQENCIYRLITK